MIIYETNIRERSTGRLKAKITSIKKILESCTGEPDCEYLCADMIERLFALEHIYELWDEFSKVPINPDCKTIMCEWHGFPISTHEDVIWSWFEDYFGINVVEDLIINR